MSAPNESQLTRAPIKASTAIAGFIGFCGACAIGAAFLQRALDISDLHDKYVAFDLRPAFVAIGVGLMVLALVVYAIGRQFEK